MQVFRNTCRRTTRKEQTDEISRIVNSREHIESLFNVKETGYASLQEYMQKNYA